MAIRTRPAPIRSTPLFGGRRARVAESAALAGGWGLFLVSWLKVIFDEGFSQVPFTLLVLLAVAGTVVAATTMWIRHNVGIYRRKGPRRAGRSIALEANTDFLGHELVGNWVDLRSASRISVSTSAGRKEFAALDLVDDPGDPDGRYQEAS